MTTRTIKIEFFPGNLDYVDRTGDRDVIRRTLHLFTKFAQSRDIRAVSTSFHTLLQIHTISRKEANTLPKSGE